MLNTILDDLRDYLQWEQEEGTLTAEVSPVIMEELAAPSPRDSSREVSVHKVPAPTSVARGTDSDEELKGLAAEIAECRRCDLHKERTHTVPGQGHPHPEILFVGEAPGRDEDAQGLAFVGRAGQLLTRMIEAMGFSRDDVFIANINKCRPPNNRKPTREEMDTCLPFLKRQIAVLQPSVIIAMGATALEGLMPLPEGETISKLRGRWFSFEGIPLMPTYHPAYLLRNPAMKRPVWEDLKAVLKRLGRPVPASRKPETGAA